MLEIAKLLYDLGMKKVLEGLIASLPVESEEKYLLILKKDLQTALDNYNNRYKEK